MTDTSERYICPRDGRPLEEQGLVSSRAEPTGGRPRMVYDLTEAGREALLGWLNAGDEPLYELRDEGMLKLFFSDAAGPRLRVQNIRAMRARQERKLAALRELEAKIPQMPEGPALTLGLGIRVTEEIIEWCHEAEQRLAPEEN